MVTQDYPLTVPKLAEKSGYHPEVVRHLMAKPDHHSGTTPRWRGGRELPSWRFAVVLPAHEKVPLVKPLCDVMPADLPDVVAWMPDEVNANRLVRHYMLNFWSITIGREKAWLAEWAKNLGGARWMKPLVSLSLGAGVQSSTLALMAARGEIDPMPDCAIFSDTGAEPKPVYEWLNELEKLMPFPLHRVMWKDGLLNNITEAVKGGRFAGAPFFTENEDFNSADDAGQLRRQCTKEFKIQPITQKLRELLGAKKGQRLAHLGVQVVQYIGISLDEIIRMKPSLDKWIEHRWPLIDKRMTRWDCMRWLEKNGYPVPPKSACTFCPYHGNAEWRWLKENDPDGWRQAVEVDRLIRGGVRGTKFALYLHRDMVPLEEVDLSTDIERGQLSLFGNECEGMCGI